MELKLIRLNLFVNVVENMILQIVIVFIEYVLIKKVNVKDINLGIRMNQI